MLSEELVKKIPDLSGARSSNRFDFQSNWAICELLERYKIGEDFVFLFDYHEDVVILSTDLRKSDYSADFYQIKTNTKNKPWGKKDLIVGKKARKKKEEPEIEERLPSIMGKLYLNKHNFKDDVRSLNFISNAKFSFKLKDGTNSESRELICLVDLEDSELDEFKQHIQLEYKLTHSCDFPNYTYFKVTELTVNGSSTYTTGKIAETLEELFPASNISSGKLYKVIYDDIKRKNNKESAITSSFSDLVANKGLTRAEIDKIFSSNIQINSDSKWIAINNELTQGQIYNLKERQVLQDKYREIHLRLPANTKFFEKLSENIKEFYNSNFNGNTLAEAIEFVYNSFDFKEMKDKINDPWLIKAIIIYSIYG